MRRPTYTLILTTLFMLTEVGANSSWQENQRHTSIQTNSQAGICPTWGSQSNDPSLSGLRWQRSGGRKIFLEWSLSPTNLDGKPISRRFTEDEEQHIRSAVAWWDSVFETIDFREVGGDYAQIKIGSVADGDTARTRWWYWPQSMRFQRGSIPIKNSALEFRPEWGSMPWIESEVRRNLGFLLGVKSGLNYPNVTNATMQSKLRALYGENSCYPVNLAASWDTSSGLDLYKPAAAVGSVQRVKFNYAGISKVGVSVLTPDVCRSTNFSVDAKSGLILNITGQGVCSVLFQAKEGFLPFSTEVLTLPTGFSQIILISGVPKLIKVGKSATLKAITNSGLPVKFSSRTPSVCKVTGAKVTGMRSGNCSLVAVAEGSSFGQLRFLTQEEKLNFVVRR